MYLEKSKTIEWPTAWPASEVPPPRESTDTPSRLATSITACTSALMARHDHADGLDLINRRIGGIEQPRIFVEANIAFDTAL